VVVVVVALVVDDEKVARTFNAWRMASAPKATIEKNENACVHQKQSQEL